MRPTIIFLVVLITMFFYPCYPVNAADLYVVAVFDLKADHSARLTGKETLEEVIQTAIQLEKEFIVYICGLKEMVPVHLGKDKINLIVKKKMGHITNLNKQLRSLKK